MLRRIAAVLSVLFIGSILTLCLFFRGAKKDTLDLEVAKSLLQVGFVAVAGAVIAILTFEYQREQQTIDKNAELERQANDKKVESERQAAEKNTQQEFEIYRKNVEYREQLLMSILSKARDAYSRVKKARRLVRARAIATQAQAEVVLAVGYDKCFDVINDAQLDLENLAGDVGTSEKAFSSPAVLKESLSSMESYLGKIITEYEKSRRRFSGGEPALPLRDLPILEDFLQSARVSKFGTQVIKPYQEVQKQIRADLLHPKLPEKTINQQEM